MLRRRLEDDPIPVLLAPLVGFLISYFFTAKYTSHRWSWWRDKKCRKALCNRLLRPISRSAHCHHAATGDGPESNQSSRSARTCSRAAGISTMCLRKCATACRSSWWSPTWAQSRTRAAQEKQGGSVLGFYVNFTTANPHDAQDICNDLTSAMPDRVPEFARTAGGQCD